MLTPLSRKDGDEAANSKTIEQLMLGEFLTDDMAAPILKWGIPPLKWPF